MFDLHMHTDLSDGDLSVDELYQRLETNGIKLFSITDHNHALAYNSIDDVKIPMIKGTEITTSYQGRIIEILGYQIEPEIINAWFHSFYSKENMVRNEHKLFNELKNLAKSLGYEIKPELEMEKVVKGESKKTIYYHLKETEKSFEFQSYKSFFRDGLSNPDSQWFIDEGRYYPSIEEVISLIHDAGGIAILAHPYEYGLENLRPLFDYLIENDIDGIECFHPSASMRESIELVKYCSEKQLYGSGGSDFHRDNRLIPHGVHLHKDILEYSCFDWLKSYL